ncbi:liprin-beta-2-like isoform X2 [Megalops cyprinoides]|uniref:liprin-beta-2-like isoform X2 n=1 Tax=Megalops cyprinoides TaxID=118141 RepID=UPI001864DF43|nr:liprin-beta-2-like isoform X2 [Megalops cyprinoides]
MCNFQQEISTRIQEKKALEEQANASSQATQESTATDLGSSHTEDICHCRGENGLLQELRLLKNKVDELEGEKSQYERKLKATKAEIADLEQLLATKDAEIECLQNQLSSRGPTSGDSAEKDQLMQRLKTGMETLLAANDEKDRRIEELRVLLNQYRRIKDFMALAQVSGERILSGSSEEELSASLKMSSSSSSPLLVFPLLLQKELESSCKSVLMSPGSMVSPGDTGFQNGQWMQTSSLEELQSGSYQKHVVEESVEPVVSAETLHIDVSKYQTLPGKLSRCNQNGGREKHSAPLQKSADESENRNFSLNWCRSASAPALGKTEKMGDTTFPDLPLLASIGESEHQSPLSQDNYKDHKGIKKLWGNDMSTPFSKWTKEQVCGWMEDYGLGHYVNLARQWVNNGQTLLSATPQDFEKEMGIRHPLHRKKLQLALRSFNTKVMEKSSELDHTWVTRWLDDIGLPQYKDQFNESRVDGRMIQYLTVNDLLFLKVTSQFHHLSIKCAIHVLHANKFNPHCLRRRPGDENKASPSEVVQWSNHRVMEWLRSVDLAEYAPNLRGSGVHGGMIILEPRFNSDTFAMLLNIPPQKTLLRRHLATNFNTLVGPQAQQKSKFSESSGHAPLTTTAKVRPKKLGFSSFGHLWKKKLDDSTDYICPTLELNVAVHPYSGFRGLSPILDCDAERKDQVG